MVVAQLAERSLPILGDKGSILAIGRFLLNIFTANVCRNDENKRKRGRELPTIFLTKSLS